MLRVGVLGATGYSGRELITRILRHPRLKLVSAACRQDVGKCLSEVMPGSPQLTLVGLDELKLDQLDWVFLCLPHGASAEWAQRSLAAGCGVVDLSADFRLRSAQLYQEVYGIPHPCPELLDSAVYGLTELARDRLRGARLIANPGCYPSSILLALAPLAVSGLVIADSKSGVSGAGRSATLANLYGAVCENVRPYSVGHQHRHVAEICQQLGHQNLIFVPQVVPAFRGMLSNLYIDLPAIGEEQYREFYAQERFVEVLPAGQVASTAHSWGTNRCVISLHPLPDQGRWLIISSLDNLVKGAAGQALQNLNASQGWPEWEGLL
jgi:N-acetyl-gamma-glutamyl-phosphate reductase